MSETHPSAPSLKKGRSRQRLRKLVDCWPLLVWLLIFGAAIAGYNKGVVFTRMNGVVDVFQESIAPTEDGTFWKLAPGIETGKLVKDGDVIAYMDPNMIDLEIERFKERRRLRGEGNAERAHDRLVELKQDQWDVQRKINALDAEITMLQAQLSKVGDRPELQATKTRMEFDISLLEIEKTSRTNESEGLLAAIKEREVILEEIRTGERTEVPLDPDDQKQLEMMQLRRSRTELIARRDGTVDRILKEPGEFVRAGESIAKVVAEPTQILGFLPQQEVTALQQGATVWVTSTVDRYSTFESTIIDLSPRIDNVRDAASPLPNQAVRGRTVLIAYPRESGFLPGQTVIIHVQPPGELSLLNRFFGLF